MSNTHRETFAIKITSTIEPLFIYSPDQKLRGFDTRNEAEEYLAKMNKEPGLRYAVVFVREYFNRAMDENGNYTRSTGAEIKEPET